MPTSVSRRREQELLRADQKRLQQLLRRIAADTKAASELAASVQRRLVEELAERRRTEGEAEVAAIDAELQRMLVSAAGLRLQLLFEPAGGALAIDLPLHATVADLWAAVHSAGGPVPPLQVLSVGGQRLLCLGGTPLSATRLITQDACVTVRRRDPRRRCIDVGSNYYGAIAAALLEDGEVWWADTYFACSDGFGGAESVHCGEDFCAAVVGGRLRTKDWRVPSVYSHRYAGEAIACCSAEGRIVATVDGSGQLRLMRRPLFPAVRKDGAAADGGGQLVDRAAADGQLVEVDSGQLTEQLSVPAALRCRVAAVSVGTLLIAVLTCGGEVHTVRCDELGAPWVSHAEQIYLGGGTAVAVSVGSAHGAALMDDGSVRCFGDNDSGQCNVPIRLCDVVSVECGPNCTVALRSNGRLSWWGVSDAPRTHFPVLHHMGRIARRLFPASFNPGRLTAIAAGSDSLLTVSADGRLVQYRYEEGVEMPFAAPPPSTVAPHPPLRALVAAPSAASSASVPCGLLQLPCSLPAAPSGPLTPPRGTWCPL
eukprot:TRINITY_DN439_c0_g1_i4.p1 TRINITY_DN439_c0_g1~~TRINITY_DN439_c0_g1_i4.p1  ORF type:complete len:552 (+),score=127.19 TRINITY_DN439_c0_g1_i4:37-1656(+)